MGVHFRGMSSFGMVPAGYKRSLNVALDFVDEEQRIGGYKTLNLLNAHEDPSFMSSVLYSHIARQYLPAPKANFVRVVINGECWGLYASVQQFNKEFLDENFKTTKGHRWKVRGSPGGGGGLDYVGDNIDDYRRRYDLKSGDSEKAWKSLVELCKTLSQTPAAELPAAIEPILDVDGALRFLALDCALINNDGYWVRASDYSLYRDKDGRFHVIPHDMNEAFRPGMMMGFAGPGGFGRGGRAASADGRGVRDAPANRSPVVRRRPAWSSGTGGWPGRRAAPRWRPQHARGPEGARPSRWRSGTRPTDRSRRRAQTAAIEAAGGSRLPCKVPRLRPRDCRQADGLEDDRTGDRPLPRAD